MTTLTAVRPGVGFRVSVRHERLQLGGDPQARARPTFGAFRLEFQKITLHEGQGSCLYLVERY